MTGITTVAFNGTTAEFQIAAKMVVIAKVPTGATTGFVKVTAPRDTLTSSAPFQILP